MKKILLILLLSPAFGAAFGQTFQIMRYGIEDGLCHESTYTIVQDKDGFVWISTSQGLCKLDGIHFTSEFPGDTLPTSIAAKSFRDSRDRIWFGYLDGQIAVLEENHFRVFPQEDADVSAIAGFDEDEEGNIIVMTQQHGMITVNKNYAFAYDPEPFQGTFTSDFILAGEGQMLLGAFNGLLLFEKNADGIYEKKGRIPGAPFTRIQDIREGVQPGTWWLGTEDEGLYKVTGAGGDPAGSFAEAIGVERGLEYSSVTSVIENPTGYLWVSDYGKGVYRFGLTRDGSLGRSLLFNVEGGMPEAYIKDLMKDDEGNIWFASQSNGVAILRDQAFTFYDVSRGQDVPEITSISIQGGDYWLGSREGMLYLADATSDNNWKSFGRSEGLPGDEISALWQDEKNNLYIGTTASGVFFLDRNSLKINRYFRSDNSLGNLINAIDGDLKTIWIATNDGLYSIEKSDGTISKK